MWTFQKDLPPCCPLPICFDVRHLNISFLRKQALPTGSWPHLTRQVVFTPAASDWESWAHMRNYIEKAVLAPQSFSVYSPLNGRIRNNPMKCCYHLIFCQFYRKLERLKNIWISVMVFGSSLDGRATAFSWVPKLHRVMASFEFQSCEKELDISFHLLWVTVLNCHMFPVTNI